MLRSSFIALFIAGILPIAAGVGCAQEPRPGTHSIPDATLQTVGVPAHPEHVLSLCTSATDTILRLGEGARLAGIDEYSRIVPGASNLAVLGKGSALSREQVLARRIDLAFVWWFQDDVTRLLADLEVPVVRLRCGRASEVPATIRLVGECLGATNRAETLAQDLSRRLAELAQPETRAAPRVYLELYSAFKTSGRDSYLNDLIELAGGRNIAAKTAGSILISAEQLIAADPQCVILVEGFGSPAQFARRSGLAGLSAVKAGRVGVLDRYYLVAGAGLPEGVAALRQLLNTSP